MTTSWGEAFRNSQEYEAPDPVWETLDFQKDVLEHLADKGGMDECSVERKAGAGGREDIAGYVWSVTCSRYDDASDTWTESLQATGTYDLLKSTLERMFGAFDIEEFSR